MSTKRDLEGVTSPEAEELRLLSANKKAALRVSPNTLYRDLQTVRAYATNTSRLGVTAATNSRPSTSSRLQQQQLEDSSEEEEDVMELKRQLVVARQDLNFSKVQLREQEELLAERDRQIFILTDAPQQLTRSISTSGHPPNSLEPPVGGGGGGPGSPYRASAGSHSGSLNGLVSSTYASRPSLNKEIMQRLRSMTETIKMLSDENAVLRSRESNLDSKRIGDYEDLSKPQLVTLVVSYDEKLKALSAELTSLSAAKAVKPDEDQGKAAAAPGQEKDKYKALARRLKEERNQYKDAIQEKLQEQESLREEMSKMSDLIGELREHCQQLRSELMRQQRSVSVDSQQQQQSAAASTRDFGAQVSLESGGSSSSRTSSLTNLRRSSVASNESARKARSVYSNGGSSTNISSKKVVAAAPVAASNRSRLTNGTNKASETASPVKAKVAKPSPAHTTTASSRIGAKIAKPVAKPSAISSPSKLAASPSRLSQPSPSRIPQPSSSRQQQPQQPPPPTPSPPPPPPPSQLPPAPHAATPTPPMSPVAPSSPPPKHTIVKEDSFFDEERSILEEEDEVLLVQEDGRIQINSISKKSNLARKSAGSSSSGESTPPDFEPPSADDEGSRDGGSTAGDNDDPAMFAATPRTQRRREESLKQGLAARRIQRTWKHFYEENGETAMRVQVDALEERREQNPDVPLSKLAEHSLMSTDFSATNNRQQQLQNSAAATTTSSPQLAMDNNRKLSLPANLSGTGGGQPEEPSDFDYAISGIQSVMQGHHARSKSLSTLRSSPSSGGGGRIHIARPWLKKKNSSSATPVAEESSEEELERVCSSLQGALMAHERRRLALQRLEKDRGMFTEGKVSAMREKFNEIRGGGNNYPRSDGVTDDDEDVVY